MVWDEWDKWDLDSVVPVGEHLWPWSESLVEEVEEEEDSLKCERGCWCRVKERLFDIQPALYPSKADEDGW